MHVAARLSVGRFALDRGWLRMTQGAICLDLTMVGTTILLAWDSAEMWNASEEKVRVRREAGCRLR